MIGDRAQLSLDLFLTDFYSTLFIAVQNAVLEQDARDHADQKYEDKENDPQTSQECQSVKELFDFL